MRLVLDKQAQEREKSGLPVPLSHHFPVMGYGAEPHVYQKPLPFAYATLLLPTKKTAHLHRFFIIF